MTKTITVGAQAQYTTKVSDDDYEYLLQFKWTFGISHRNGAGNVYVRRCVYEDGTKRTELMHRVILKRSIGDPPTERHTAHHINSDTLYNVRENLAWELPGAKHRVYKRKRKEPEHANDQPIPY